jgi:hypothetical protein
MWESGQSGNPAGRPLNYQTWKALIKSIGEAKDTEGVPRKIKAANALWSKAEEGDIQALKEIGDRLEGKPQQTNTNINTEVEGDSSLPPEEQLKEVLERIKRLQQ